MSDRRGPPASKNNGYYDRQERERFLEDALEDQEDGNFDGQNRARNGDNNLRDNFDDRLPTHNPPPRETSRRMNENSAQDDRNDDYGRNARLPPADRDYPLERTAGDRDSRRPSRNEYPAGIDRSDYNDENFDEQNVERYGHCDRESKRYNDNDSKPKVQQKTIHDPRNPSYDDSNDYGIDLRPRRENTFRSDVNAFDERDTRYSRNEDDERLRHRRNQSRDLPAAQRYQESEAFDSFEPRNTRREVNRSTSNHDFDYGNETKNRENVPNRNFTPRPAPDRYSNTSSRVDDRYSDDRGNYDNGGSRERRRYDDNENVKRGGYGSEVSSASARRVDIPPSRNQNSRSQYCDDDDYLPQRLPANDQRDNRELPFDDEKYPNHVAPAPRAERNPPPSRQRQTINPTSGREDRRYTPRENPRRNGYQSPEPNDILQRQGYGNDAQIAEDFVRLLLSDVDEYRAPLPARDEEDYLVRRPAARNEINHNYERNSYADQDRSYSRNRDSKRDPPPARDGSAAVAARDDDRYSNASLPHSRNDYGPPSRIAPSSRTQYSDNSRSTRDGYRSAAVDVDDRFSNASSPRPCADIPPTKIVENSRSVRDGYGGAAPARDDDRYNDAPPRRCPPHDFGYPSRLAPESRSTIVDDAPPRGGYDRFTNSEDRYSSSAVADRQEGYDGREIGRREGLPATLEERKNSSADNYGIRGSRDERSSYSNNPPLSNGFGNNDRFRFGPIPRNESFSSAGGGDSYGTRYEGGGIDNHQNNNKDYTTFASESKNSGQQSYNSGGNTTTSSNQTTNFGNNLPVASSRPAPPEVYATESRAHPPAAPAVAVVKNLPVASPAPPKAYTNERPVAEAPPPAPLPVLPVKKTDPFNFVNQYNPPYRQSNAPTPSLPSTSTALPSNNGTASTTATSAKQPTTTTDKPADNQEDDDFWD